MLKLKNLRLYTGRQFFPDGVVLVEGRRIAYAGDVKGAPQCEGCEEFDGQGGIAMPGLVNAHSHSPMVLMRGVGSDLDLMDWLGQIMPIEEGLDGDCVYWGSTLACMEMARRGATAFADMYFFMGDVARAAADAGLRANISRGSTSREGVDSDVELYHEWHNGAEGRIKVYVGLHGEYTSNPDVARYAIEQAARLGAGIHTHMSESKAETDGCYARHGVSPVRYFYDLGMYENPTLAAHCVHLSDEDIALLAEGGVYVAHNPASNLKLGSGVARVDDMIEAGVRVALGTDGASSNNTLDMFADMKLAAMLQKGVNRNPRLMPNARAIEMATLTGARALGYDDLGLLEAGMLADLLVLRADGTNMLPGADPVADIVYAAQGLDVRLTMVNGKIVYRDGEFPLIDRERVFYECRACAKRLGVGV